MGGSGGDFAAERFKLAGLLEVLVGGDSGVFHGADMYWED